MATDNINPNVPGLDTQIPRGRMEITTRASEFLASASAGALIAALVDPFGAGSTYVVVGTAPAQLALSGSTIVKGSGTAVAGTVYRMKVLATSADGLRETSSVLSFTATSAAAPAPTPSPSPTIAFASPSATVPEGNSGTTTVTNTINITRNGASGALTINITYGGTAAGGVDYATAPTSVTIGAGQSSASFDILINGDATVEPDETIVITAALSGYAGVTATKTITITNDDAAAPSPSARLASSRLVMAQQAVSNNTDGNSNTRISFYNASGATITHGQFLYSTARLNTANEGAASGPLTVTASHEAAGGAISRMGGGAAVTVPSTGDALLLGPEIELVSPTAPGEQAYARTYVVSPGGVVFPQNLTPKYTGAASLGEMQDFATGVDKTDGSAITNVAPAANKLSFGPIAFIATRWSGTPNGLAYVGVGDSLIDGSKDKDEAGSVSQGNLGYAGKALAGVAPYAKMSIGGAVASTQPGNMTRRLAALALMKPSHVVLGYGTNDLLSGRTATQLAGDISTIAGAIKAAVPGVKIIVPTLMPDTTSSDFFATSSGQTITANPAGAFTGGVASERSKYNAAVRAGLANVDHVFDAANLVEVDASNNLAQDGGRWMAGGDGVTPGAGTGYSSTYLGTSGATAAASDDGRHPWLSTTTGSGKGAIAKLRDAFRAKVQANWA